MHQSIATRIDTLVRENEMKNKQTQGRKGSIGLKIAYQTQEGKNLQ